jgi:hypothetical protein
MLRRLSSAAALLRAFCEHRGAGLAPIAALTAVAMTLAAGSAVDIGRTARARTLLQDVADSAALAGASQGDPTSAVNSATAYVNAALGAMTDKPTVTATYNVAPASEYASPPSSGVPFSVTLSGSMPTSIMAMVVQSLPMSVAATAQANVGQKVTFTLTNYSSDAADHNIIYGYGYDPTAYTAANGKLYPFVPTIDTTKPLLDNRVTYPSGYTTSFWIGLNDSVGLALSNTTGTSQNCYGGNNGTNRFYYSHRLDTTGQYHDYPTENFNWCGFSTVTSNADGTKTIDNVKATVPGQDYSNECYSCLVTTTTTYTDPSTGKACTPEQGGRHNGQCDINGRYVQPNSKTTTSGPVNQWNTSFTGDGSHGYVYTYNGSRNPLRVNVASQDCTSSGGVSYNWDDNGGGSDSGISSPSQSGDDDDHNDMVFTITCTKAVKPGTARLTG